MKRFLFFGLGAFGILTLGGIWFLTFPSPQEFFLISPTTPKGPGRGAAASFPSTKGPVAPASNDQSAASQKNTPSQVVLRPAIETERLARRYEEALRKAGRNAVPNPLPRTPFAKETLLSPPGRDHRITVKFMDDSLARVLPDGTLVLSRPEPDEELLVVIEKHGLRFSPMHTTEEEALVLLEARAMANTGKQPADLSGMLSVTPTNPTPEGVLAAAQALQQLGVVEFVTLSSRDAPPPPPAVDLAPPSELLEDFQTYRGSSGINILSVASSLDVRGDSVQIINCEYSFNPDHEDLAGVVSAQPGVTEYDNFFGNDHGTAVLGILGAAENSYGMTGMVPDADLLFYGDGSTVAGMEQSRPATVAAALTASGEGDVVLLEMQTNGIGSTEDDPRYVPAEFDLAVFTAVQLGTAAGTHVVAAAGNGGVNLDGPDYQAYRDRGDSGAIIVGAGSASRQRLGFSTYGARVNVQGWGQGVATLGYGDLRLYGGDDNQSYTRTFNGTSSASPVVTAAVAALESVHRREFGASLSPSAMRDLLEQTGRPQSGGATQPIGPLPDVFEAMRKLGILPPMVFANSFSVTNPVGGFFSAQIFTPLVTTAQNVLASSTYSSVTSTVTTNRPDGSSVTARTVVTTNQSVFTSRQLDYQLPWTVTNGLRLIPERGVVEGVARTNFILSFSNDFIAGITQRTSSRTNISVTRAITVISNDGVGNITTNRLPITQDSFTNTFGSTNTDSLGGPFTNSNSTFRMVFQLPARVTNFPVTRMGAAATSILPVTNPLGLRYGYQLVSGDGVLSATNETNYLTSTGPRPARLRVSLFPTSPALEIWASNSATISVEKTNSPVAGFAFVTNTTIPVFTRTNLIFGQSTPLVVTNAGRDRVSYLGGFGGRIFFSNHPLIPSIQIPFFQATTGTGTSSVSAILAATATSAATTSTVNITLTQAPAPAITMLGVFSNLAWTNSNAAVTTAALVATNPGRYTIGFTSTNTNLVRIDNNRTLVMLANGTSQIVASILFLDTNNFLQSQPVTNTLVVEWASNPPVFTSTNRQDGVQGVPFTYFMVAGPNTNAFPITYGATNLAPGLIFLAPNRIVGTPTNAGLFRMQLTASNAAGTTNGQLLSYFTNFPPLRVTNAWSFVLSLGLGSDTNGTYLFSTNGSDGTFAADNLPPGIGSVTNSNSATPPVLVLTNTNTNPANGFVGTADLYVRYSNPVTGLFDTRFELKVLPPVAPSIAYDDNTFSLAAGQPVLIPNRAHSTLSGSPFSYRATNLPPGLLVLTNGSLRGTPSQAGRYLSIITASNREGRASTNLTFEVAPMSGFGWSLSLSNLFPGQAGTYSVLNLPPGLSLNTNSGLLSGTVLGAGQFPLTVVLNSNGLPIGTNTTNLLVAPPVPVLNLPSGVAMAKRGQAFFFQPWVTGPGWGWAGADTMDRTHFSPSLWTNRMVFTNGAGATNTNRISANANGTLVATTNGMSFTNNRSNNTLALLWNAGLPSSWPWQAVLRMRVPGTLTNGLAGPFLGAFRAQAPFSTNFYDQYAEAFLDASVLGKIPGAAFLDASGSGDTNLETVGTNEIAVRLIFDTNDSSITMGVNTNPNTDWAAFTGVLTNTDLGNAWNLTNAAEAFRLWAGFSASNQAVTPRQALLRGFALLPGGVTFSATNLPPWGSIDPALGTIYGTPDAPGTNTVVITVSNVSGSSQGTFRLIVSP